MTCVMCSYCDAVVKRKKSFGVLHAMENCVRRCVHTFESQRTFSPEYKRSNKTTDVCCEIMLLLACLLLCLVFVVSCRHAINPTVRVHLLPAAQQRVERTTITISSTRTSILLSHFFTKVDYEEDSIRLSSSLLSR